MDVYLVNAHEVVLVTPPLSTLETNSFYWVDTSHEEVERDADAWRDQIESLVGTRILDLHLLDAINLAHPSYFDSTHEYEMVVFRKLMLEDLIEGAPGRSNPPPRKAERVPALANLATRPVTFFLFTGALVTVSPRGSRIIEQARSRLLDYRIRSSDANQGARPGGMASHQGRLPARPEDLMLRLLNAMVDSYLDLRQPLTEQLDRWQRELLDPRREFHNWAALLDARIQLRKLENLCEEQQDALQEFRDNLVDLMDQGQPEEERFRDRHSDILMVRTNDVIGHIARVLQHVRRLEDSVESAVELHFSATAHRTNEIVRTLTVITAIFAPLTLITGVFGMNFETMPLLKHGYGFWVAIAAMAGLAIVLLSWFKIRRYLNTKPQRRRPL